MLDILAPHRVTHRLKMVLLCACILYQDKVILDYVHEMEVPNQPPGRQSLEPIPPGGGGQAARIASSQSSRLPGPYINMHWSYAYLVKLADQPVLDRETTTEESVVETTESGGLSATVP